MTGIYEAAISELCKYKGGPGAKVIASTATIRNAGWQLLELYGKNYTQFPPQGISIKDSYFAVESKPENKPARLYCGVMGVGTTPTTTLIRHFFMRQKYLKHFTSPIRSLIISGLLLAISTVCVNWADPVFAFWMTCRVVSPILLKQNLME